MSKASVKVQEAQCLNNRSSRRKVSHNGEQDARNSSNKYAGIEGTEL